MSVTVVFNVGDLRVSQNDNISNYMYMYTFVPLARMYYSKVKLSTFQASYQYFFLSE